MKALLSGLGCLGGTLAAILAIVLLVGVAAGCMCEA